MFVYVCHNHQVKATTGELEIMRISLDELWVRPKVKIKVSNVCPKASRKASLAQASRIVSAPNIENSPFKLFTFPGEPPLERHPGPDRLRLLEQLHQGILAAREVDHQRV